MLEVCKQLFDRWNSGVRYCHWKSNEHLMEGLDGETDLDVFVQPSDKELAETMLIQSGYLECRTQKEHQYPNVFEWIGFDSATGKLVHVHLHYQIITGTKFCKEYVFPIDDLIISTRVQDVDTGVFVTDPNLEIIILYSRIALKATKKHCIKPDKSSVREIIYLKALIDKDKVLSYCRQLIPKFGDDYCQIITEEELDASGWFRVYQIAKEWLEPYRKYSQTRVFFRHFYYKSCSSVIKIANNKFNRCIVSRKTFPGRSFSVCLLGQDGSGKSTVTIALEKWLTWKIEARRFYLGSGDHYNSLLKRFIVKSAKYKHRNDITRKEYEEQIKKVESAPTKRKKTIKNFFVAVLVAKNHLDVARRAYKVVLCSDNYCRHGGIPLFDRFPQIQFEGIYDGPKIANYCRETGLDYFLIRLMAKREHKYIEKIQHYQPKLVFKLMLSPEESIRRKPFEHLDAVARKHEITKQLQFANSKVRVVDATQDYQQELLYIKNEIWKMLQDKSE